MFLLKRWLMVGTSLVLAGMMLILAMGLVSAAGGTWKTVGFDGGVVRQLVAVKTSPTLLYARSDDGSGIWKSTDGAATWQMTSLAVFSYPDDDANLWLDAMAVSADGQKVYAASTHRGPAGNGSHLWRSSNGGTTWSLTLVETSSVRALAVFSSANRVIAGSTNNDDNLPNLDRSIFYSPDGASWTLATLSVYTEADIFSLAEGAGFMYAGGRAFVPALGDYVPAVYTSANGVTWSLAFTTTSLNDGAFRQIVADPGAPNRAYALVGLDWGEVVSTTDGGRNWSSLNFNNEASALAVDSQGRVYLADGDMVYRSVTNGATWAFIGQTNDQIWFPTIAVDPTDNNILYFGSGGGKAGVYKTPASYQVSAAAFTFVEANSGLRAYRIRDLAGIGDTIYAASSGQGVLKSSDGGQTWSRVSEGDSDWATSVAVQPGNANVAYFGDWGEVARVYRTSDGGNIWELRNQGLPTFTNVDALAIDPGTPAILYAATERGVFKTSDSGLHWSATSIITRTYALAIQPTSPYTVYAAVDFDDFYMSADHGATWTPLGSGQDCPNNVFVNPITPTEVYAAGCEGFSKYAGGTWTHLYTYTNIMWGGWPNKLAVDTSTGVIYAALGPNGLYASEDGGQTWSQVTESGIPTNTGMSSLFYNDAQKSLILGTHAGLALRSAGSEVFLPIILKN